MTRRGRGSACSGSCRASTTTCCRASPSARPRTPPSSAAALGDVAERRGRAAGQGARGRRARDARASRPRDLDGLLVVMLTYGPAMHVARAARRDAAADLPGQHPAGPGGHGRVGHGRPDVQPGHPRRAGHGQRDGARRAPVPRRHRRLARRLVPRRRSRDWARAAAAVTRWRSLKVAVFGYAMNGMGDIRVDEHALMRALGPQVDALAPGALQRGRRRGRRPPRSRALIAAEDARFEIDPRLSARRARGPRADAARDRARCCARAATAPTRRTSARSPRTAASPACRSPPRRA